MREKKKNCSLIPLTLLLKSGSNRPSSLREDDQAFKMAIMFATGDIS